MSEKSKKPLVKFIKINSAAQLPTYAHKGDSGMDLRTIEEFTLLPNERKTVSTGLRIKIQDGFEGQVRPRSGLAHKEGLTIVNSPGTIDSPYDGELKVILLNTSDSVNHYKVGDKIAQLVIVPVEQAEIIEVAEFNEETTRGSSGFGSTGKN